MWSNTTAVSATWTGSSAAGKSWSGSTVAAYPPPWGVLSSVTTTADEGVDFVLRAREQYPLHVSSDRPLAVYDVQPEGKP